jgi:hypothetical protein
VKFLRDVNLKIKNYIAAKKIWPTGYPIIILGNQKSGTSAIAVLLAELGGLSKIIDIPETWWPNLEKLLSHEIKFSEFYFDYRFRFNYQIIKEPNLTFFYPEIKNLFPKAIFIFVIRDPRDNIRSFLNRMNIDGDLISLEKSNIKMPEKWKIAFDNKQWNSKYEHYIEILADRWRFITEIYLQNPNEFIQVKYEDFKESKIESIRNLAQRLGIAEKNDISSKVDIQYQPKGNNNTSWIDFFGEENLHRIEIICKDHMLQFGYKPITL